jgi:hypothetical protein
MQSRPEVVPLLQGDVWPSQSIIIQWKWNLTEIWHGVNSLFGTSHTLGIIFHDATERHGAESV